MRGRGFPVSDTTRLDEIRERAADIDGDHHYAARIDVPWLLAELDRTRVERDAALAAVTAVREFIDEVDELHPDARWTPSMWTWKIRAALGKVGQSQDECEHCESTGRCVGSCLDDPREDPNGE